VLKHAPCPVLVASSASGARATEVTAGQYADARS
jgi:hypothetical protein